jgi:hypothetical protein
MLLVLAGATETGDTEKVRSGSLPTLGARVFQKSGEQHGGGLSQTQGEQQRMSDTVWVALVTGIPGVIASVLRYVDRRDIRRSVTLAEKTAQLAEKNEQHLVETKTAMVILEKNTNSIKDELVRTTAMASRAVGNLEGRAQQKAEHSKGESEEHAG